jgi:hypothetical protein
MGLLDDAIRDHLDLKRRRGADPGEVERDEREALGPVRRNPTPDELAEMEAAADGAPAPESGPAYDQAGDDSWSHDSLQEPAGEAEVAPLYEEPPVQPPPEFPAQQGVPPRGMDDHPALEPLEEELLEEEAPPFDEDPFEEEPSRESRPAEREPASPPAVGGVGPETAEYNVEDVLAAEDQEGGGDEDVLEETPEFLQDTPEHDRLWFEQRPPKDFDFDE